MKPAPEFARTATVTVLLVEDDPDFAALVRRCVAGLGGRSGLTAVATLQEALQALRYGAFDLILLDLGLPDSSGLATLEGIAAATERPIIVLTANEDAGIHEDSLSAGAYEFLHKKRFDAGVLARLVRLAAMQARTFGSLRESEARFRSLVALSSDYYWEQDASHRVTYVSAEYEAAAGGPGEAILGKRRWDYDISNMTEHAWQEHRAALESRRPFRDLELMRLDQNGEERWVAISGEPVFDAAGDFRGYRGIGRDISARKRAEEGLLRFRAALDESADMIVVIDRATMKYVDVNSTVCKLLGFPRAEMLTMGPQDLLPESREALERTYDAMIADPQAENATRTHYRCKDGSLLPLEARRRALKSGKRWLIVSVGRDIRARVAAERALEESEARFRSLTQLSSDWYWEQDAEFRLTFMSSRMGERTGLDASAYLGRKRWDQPALNLSEADWQRHRGQLERHEPFRDFEMERRLDDGATVWLSLSGEPVYDAAGGFKGYRGVGRDITAQKRLDQLQRLEHNITRCLSEAESASAGLGAVLRAICETLGWACGRYFEADERAGLLRFAAGWGTPDEAVERYLAKSRELTYQRGQGLSGHVWQSAKPLWVRDVSDDPRASGSSRAASGRALQGGSFVFPVISRGTTLGVMSFSSGDPKPPHERLLQAIAVIGSQVGQFLQRKQAEVALRDSILVLEKTFAHMDQGIAIFDARLRLVAVNRRARELLAIPEAVLHPGCAFEDIIRFNAERGDYGPVDVESFVQARVAVAASGEANVVQREQANGTILEIRGKPMPDGGLIAVFTDVTASARGLQALRESEERFRETFELAGSGMAHVSLDGRFLRVNRSLCRMLGYEEGELIGRAVKDVSHASDRDVTDAERARIHDGEVQSQRFEKRYVRKDGTVAWIDLTVALARDARGRPAYEIAVMEDITAQKETQDALRRFRTALDRSADMFFLVDMKDSRLLDFNDTACAELGYLRDELIGKTSDAISDAQLADLGTHTAEATYRRKDGSTFPVEARRTVLETAEGQFLVVNSRDLTGRKREEERKSAHLRYQQRIAAFAQSALACRDPQELVDDAVQQVLVALGADAVAYVERGRHVGELVARALGGAPADAQLATVAPGSPVFQVLESGERFSAERAVLSFGWARGASATAIVPVPGDSSVRGALCVVWRSRSFGPEELNFLDAAAAVLTTGLKRVTSEERLAFLAQFDSLTGLPNRALLSDRFTQMIEQTRRRGLILGVLFVDLDDFKMVNDTLGHAAGDELLKEAARRLEATVRPGDTVARISGDEFALVLADLAHQEDAALVAQKIIERLAAPFDLSGQEMFVTASVGIASFPADGDNAEALLGAADAAMYRAKQSGRNAFQFFTAEINQRTRARALLGAELRRALEREEFALFYQPKYDLLTRRPCGAEALLRWNHPERGVIAPTEFVHVLEETGLIVPVGEWVLRRACEDVKAWAAAGVRPRPVAVNLSARQFRQSDLDARIRGLIAQAAVSPDLIELEITESQLMHDPEHAIRVMQSLRDEGIRIAIDDFGTGYSSLAYLTRLPVAALKIDRSFVAGIQGDNGDAAIVRTIIEMARTLRFIVVAEGVENEAQVEFLRQFGCHQAQGYLFARPMPAEDFRALISSDTDAASGKARPASLYQ